MEATPAYVKSDRQTSCRDQSNINNPLDLDH